MKDRNTLMDIALGSHNMPDIIMVKKNGVKTRFIPDLGQPDPYAHLKEAQARGEIIQYKFYGDSEWIDSKNLEFNDPPDRYRIKPKTKTLYKWAYKDCSGDWMQTSAYLEDEKEAKRWSERMFGVDMLQYIKRLDYTAIEVES